MPRNPSTVDLELMEARILAEIDRRFRNTVTWFVSVAAVSVITLAFSAGVMWMRVEVAGTHLEVLERRLDQADLRAQRDETIITQHGDNINDLQKHEDLRPVKGKPQ